MVDRPSAQLPFRVRVLLPLLLLVLGYASIQLYGRVPDRPVLELTGASMGTTWTVKLATENADAKAASLAIAERLARIDALMSTWRDDSELSRFNASRSIDPVPVAAETQLVLSVADRVARRSGGAFDVTVGPLVQAWGFGSRGRGEIPDEGTLSSLRERVGFQKLQIDEAAGTLSKRVPGLEVDVSAVAKGFAVDEIARALEALGHRSFLVELGGELRAAGTHRDGGPWRVAIETPDVPGRRIHRIIELRDLSMATSGDYRNYYERGGIRYSHTIDPRNARPTEHRLASVTVLHPEAVWADAWATALNVLGPEEGYALALAEELAAYFVARRIGGDSHLDRMGDEEDSGPATMRTTQDGAFETRMTPPFAPYLTEKERRP